MVFWKVSITLQKMFKYYVYIESEVIVLPLVIYAETRETAYKKAVKQFRKIFKKKKITRVTIHKDHYYFGGFEY